MVLCRAQGLSRYFAYRGREHEKWETASGNTRRNGYTPNRKNKIPDTSYTVLYGLPQKPQTTTTKGVCAMPDRKCDCPACKCTIKEGDHAYAVHGKHYCCEACAHHHKGGEECSSKGCHCAHPK